MSGPLDIIGDVHGRADALWRLLSELRYELSAGVWRHSERTAVFVGDYIDVGPQQLETINTVRRMVDAGSARALMGNHEFNAICWFTEDPANPGDFLRSRFSSDWGSKNRKQHSAFLAEFEARPVLHAEVVQWFQNRPLWFETDDLRVVHACWDPQAISELRLRLTADNTLPVEVTSEAADVQTLLGAAIERTLKGQEIELPAGVFFEDSYGIRRDHVRRKWWDEDAVTYRRSALLPAAEVAQIPDTALPDLQLFPIETDRITFFGHYCLGLDSRLLTESFGCVDTCAARGNYLTAYRWDGEVEIDTDHFVSIGI